MKQLLIVNSAKAVKTGVADDLTVLDAGQIGFFHLSPDASGANEGKVTFFNTKPTENFGIALGRGANVPAEYLDEYVSDKDKPELTPEQQQVEDWYQKAVNTFNDETTKPVMVAAALSGLPGVSQMGALAMLPMMAEDLSENVEKEGVVSGTATTALNMLPVIGSYRQTQDPQFQKYAEEHPARAAGLLLMNEAPFLAGAVQASKAIRLTELTEKFKGNVKKAKEVLKAEEQAMKPKSTPKETLQASLKETEFKPEKPNNIQE